MEVKINKMFGKKKKQENQNNINNENKKNINQEKTHEYQIRLKISMGTATKELPFFDAVEATDESTGARFLINEEKNFKEPLPEETEDYKLYKIEELEDLIEELEQQLTDENTKDNPDINVKTIRQQLKQYRKFKRSLELQGPGSYINFNSNGRPYYVYKRIGSFKFPVYDNQENFMNLIPPATRIRTCSELHNANNQKYSKHNKTTFLASSVILFLIIIGFGVACWFVLNTASDYNDSAVAQLNQKIDDSAIYCAEMYGKAGENFLKASENAVNMTTNVMQRTHQIPVEVPVTTTETKG